VTTEFFLFFPVPPPHLCHLLFSPVASSIFSINFFPYLFPVRLRIPPEPFPLRSSLPWKLSETFLFRGPPKVLLVESAVPEAIPERQGNVPHWDTSQLFLRMDSLLVIAQTSKLLKFQSFVFFFPPKSSFSVSPTYQKVDRSFVGSPFSLGVSLPYWAASLPPSVLS